MVKRAFVLAIALGLLVTPVTEAGGRHIDLSAQPNQCSLTYFANWSPRPGQVTIRYTFTDLSTGGSETLDHSISDTSANDGSSNLIGSFDPGYPVVWRLDAVILDGADTVLAKGRLRYQTNCTEG